MSDMREDPVEEGKEEGKPEFKKPEPISVWDRKNMTIMDK